MRNRLAISSTLLLMVALAGRPAPAAEEATPSWSDYRVGQFISSRGRTPDDILSLDNNGDLLLACRGGCSVAGLAANGVPALGSQLELMRDWGLLIEGEDGLRPGIPILDAAAAARLEQRASEVAGVLAGAVVGDVAELAALLGNEGWRHHAYATVFSYVLDGQVWGFFDEMQMVERRGTSRRGGHWGGVAWAYVPRRELEPRTSTLRRKEVTVKLSWVEPLRPLVGALLNGPASLQTLFTDYLEKGLAPATELTAKLMEYGIVGSERQLSLPVIEEKQGDPLYDLCGRLTTRVAETVIAELDRPALMRELGLESESEALVIGYHEIMWSLVDRLVESRAIQLPAALADPQSAGAAEVGHLVVMARPPVVVPADRDRDEEEE